MKYFARRLLHSLLLLIAVSVLSFLFAELAPGDFYSGLQTETALSTDAIEKLRTSAGLDRPLPVRYAAWAASAMRGDFGYSLAYHGPVAPLVWQRVRGTLLLTGTATLLAWMLAVPLGIWSAVRHATWRDAIFRFLLSVLLSIPDMLLAIGALVLAVKSGWFPTGGMVSPDFASLSGPERFRDVVRHMGLPVSVLVLGMLPILVRHVRAAMKEAIDSPFGMSARAQGIPQARLLFRHLLPAALNPLISLFGLSLGTLLSASLVIEVLMAWPGLGPLFLDAISARDFHLVLAVELLGTAFLIAGNLLADVLLYRADPRIRTRA